MSAVNQTGKLAGKVALVTGASRGIGEAVAYRYAAEGAKVIVTARTLHDGDHQFPGGVVEVADRIKAVGGDAIAIQADLARADDRQRTIDEAEAAFGYVDVLVNNAAVTYFRRVESFSEKHFQLMFGVQVEAPFHLSQLVMPGMKQKGGGWIVNVSSHAAIHPELGGPARGGTVYGMCKAALERMSTGLASEVVDDKIAVNVISPGLVATPGVMHHKLINEDTPAERVTPVEHMAEACLRLAHSNPSMLSGLVTYAADMLEAHSLTPAPLLHAV